jgi:transcriptional regulator GlxA family with amidase domain
MQVAVLTFDGFNELDSLVAAAIVNRLRPHGWAAHITAPTNTVTSLNGVVVQRQRPLAFVEEADAVLIGSGSRTREIAADAAMVERLRLDPSRQLIAAQCSGTLLLAKLGLLGTLPACTDLTTKPWVVEAGVTVIDAPFAAHGNVATAGGCLAAPYLAAWMIARGGAPELARKALHYVAPVGETERFVEHAMALVASAVTSPRSSRTARPPAARPRPCSASAP